MFRAADLSTIRISRDDEIEKAAHNRAHVPSCARLLEREKEEKARTVGRVYPQSDKKGPRIARAGHTRLDVTH